MPNHNKASLNRLEGKAFCLKWVSEHSPVTLLTASAQPVIQGQKWPSLVLVSLYQEPFSCGAVPSAHADYSDKTLPRILTCSPASSYMEQNN